MNARQAGIAGYVIFIIRFALGVPSFKLFVSEVCTTRHFQAVAGFARDFLSLNLAKIFSVVSQ